MLFAALLLLQAATAAAPCPATPAPLPGELAGWTPMTDVAAGATPAAITIGHGVRATLLPAAGVTLPVPNDRAKAGSNAGVYGFDVTAAGRYRVTLGAAAWIDVIAAGKPVTSAAHAHGPACSPIRKMVDFDLVPGHYLLQLSGSDFAVVPLMIAPL